MTKKNNLERRNRQMRTSTGLTLVEILVSLVIGSVVSLAMTDLFAKVLRVSNTTQNEVCANAIASELMENVKQARYDYLNANQGNFILIVNKEPSTPNILGVRDEPLLLDLVNKTWNPSTLRGKFNGTVSLTIEPMSSLVDALKVTATVMWTDTEKTGTSSNLVGRTIKTSTVVTKSGSNYYNL